MGRVISCNNLILSLCIINNIMMNFTVSFAPQTIIRTKVIKQKNLNNNYNNKHDNIILYSSNNDYTPLAKEGDWAAYLDEVETGFVYYFNGKTGESRWEPPTSSFPKIKLTKKKLDIIQKKQAEYLSTVEEEDTKKGGFSFGNVFNGFTNKQDDDVAVQEEEVVVEERLSSGFNLFGNKKEIASTEETATTAVETGIKRQKLTRSLFSFGKSSSEEDFQTKKNDLTIIASSQILPHPDKVSWGGEDAVLCLSRTYGVFDGVSGADKLDGVPLYSNTLSEILNESIDKDMEIEYGLNGVELKNLLTDAAEYADATATGASTALVASIDKDGYLHALNVGDSSLLVIRNNGIVARSREIVHYFDCPFQLAEDSPDRPKDGTKFKRLLQPGDAILMGSDGIFDNLTDEQILQFVANPKYSNNPALLLRVIINEARKISLDKEVMTPYSQMAKRYGYPEYSNGVGGKVDDISGVIALCT